MTDFNKVFGQLEDREWLDLWLAKAKNHQDKRLSDLSSFPSAELQSRFVGSAFEPAMREAYAFYLHVKKNVAMRSETITADDVLLDFGCGWGRYLRFFAKDVPNTQLYGVDVSGQIIEECRRTRVPGILSVIDSMGTLNFEESKFSIAIAYSVFTHLPEPVHLHWRRELARVLRRGATLVLTVQSKRFCRYIENRARDILGPKIFGTRVPILRRLRLSRPRDSSKWHRLLARHAEELPELMTRYDLGELVFLGSGSGSGVSTETYGDALVPVEFVEKHWHPDFKLIDVVDDKSRFAQSILTLKRV